MDPILSDLESCLGGIVGWVLSTCLVVLSKSKRYSRVFDLELFWLMTMSSCPYTRRKSYDLMLPMLLRLSLHNQQTAVLQRPTFSSGQPIAVDVLAFGVLIMLHNEVALCT